MKREIIVWIPKLSKISDLLTWFGDNEIMNTLAFMAMYKRKKDVGGPAKKIKITVEDL